MKRALSLLTCLCVFMTLLPIAASADSQQTRATEDHTIVYMPLDDRPVNTDRVQYLAQSIGYSIKMPTDDKGDPLYKTTLSIPPSTTSSFGYRTKELTWLLKMKEDGYKDYVISVDQLLSGGLVSARDEAVQFVIAYDSNKVKPDQEGFNFKNMPTFLKEYKDYYHGEYTENSGESETEQYTKIYYDNAEQFDLNDDNIITFEEFAIVQLVKLFEIPDVHVVFTEVLLRTINATKYYNGYTENQAFENFVKTSDYWAPSVKQYEKISEIFNNERSVLSNYAASDADRTFITGRIAARERKLTLTNMLLDQLNQNTNASSFEYIIGADDAKKNPNIQTNELDYIKNKVTNQINKYCFSGTDELGMTAVCRLYAERVGLDKLPVVCVKYFGGGEGEVNSSYDSDTAKEGVENHLDAIGIEDTESDETKADLVIFVLKPKDITDDLNADIDLKVAAISALYQQYINVNKPSAVINLVHFNTGYANQESEEVDQYRKNTLDSDKELYTNMLAKQFFNDGQDTKLPLINLLGYSSWNTQGNAEGVAISQGIARWMYLKYGDKKTVTDSADQGYMKSLTFDFVKDYVYKNLVMKREPTPSPVSGTLLKAMGDAGVSRILRKLGTEDNGLGTEDNGNANRLISSINQSGSCLTREVDQVSVDQYSYPWNRSFEIRFNISVTLGKFDEYVTLDANGGSVSSETIAIGADGKISTLPDPTRDHYTFNGWYTSPTGGTRVTADYVFTSGMTLYAQWILQGSNNGGSSGGGNNGASTSGTVSIPEAISGGKVTVNQAKPQVGSTVTITVTPDEGKKIDKVVVTDSGGNAVAITDKGNGVYTYTQPKGNVQINAQFISDFPFQDVPRDHKFYQQIEYVYQNKIMKGTSSTYFSPKAATNRMMIVVTLYRIEKEPAVSNPVSFPDVSPDQWYANAVAWAKSQGIVMGNTQGNFAASQPLTREQLVTMLYRYALKKEVAKEPTTTLTFKDNAAISDWAQIPLQWCVEKNIIEGKTDHTVDPKGIVTREVMAVIFYRFVEAIK